MDIGPFEDLLVTALASVENSTAFVRTPELLRMIKHLLPFTDRALFLYNSLCIEFVCIQGLNCGMF